MADETDPLRIMHGALVAMELAHEDTGKYIAKLRQQYERARDEVCRLRGEQPERAKQARREKAEAKAKRDEPAIPYDRPKIVELCRQKRAEGMSWQQVADWLNNEGYRNSWGTVFQSKSLTSMVHGVGPHRKQINA